MSVDNDQLLCLPEPFTPFFHAILRGAAKWQAMPPWPQRPGRCLLGLAPNPYLRANRARSICVALLLVFITSTLLFLLSARLGVAQQSINICLALFAVLTNYAIDQVNQVKAFLPESDFFIFDFRHLTHHLSKYFQPGSRSLL